LEEGSGAAVRVSIDNDISVAAAVLVDLLPEMG
jgi:hypothetical protein